MTNDKREALIEEAAKAIYSNERESIEGAHDWPEWDNCRPSSRESVLEAARAALAVFEQAHRVQGAKNSAQNSDDERERVEQSNEVAGIVFDQIKKAWPDLHPVLDLRYGIADALWAAGFRRPVQGEPSEAHDIGMDAIDWDMVRDGVGDPQEAASVAVRTALRAAAAVQEGGNRG